MSLQCTFLESENIEFRDYPMECFESWAYAENEDVLTKKSLEPEKNHTPDEFPQIRRLPQDQLQDWLHQKGEHQTRCNLNGSKVVGGLRLIIQESGRFPHGVIPFGKDNFKLISDTISIPQSYLYELWERLPIAYRSQQTRNLNRTGVGFLCQSPELTDRFMSLILSYDSSSNITTGILNYENSEGAPLISRLLATAHNIPHPMLPLVLVLEHWCHKFRFQVRSCYIDLTDVERQLGLLENELKHLYGESMVESKTVTKQNHGNSKKQGLDDVHRLLILSHGKMIHPIPSFIIDLAASILRGFDEIKDLNHDIGHRQIIGNCGQELREYVLQLQNLVENLFEEKGRILSQVDLQLKVLYNIMQQNNNESNFQIAMDNKKDSRAMKTISIVTMVFLPGTAIATIFSMSPFFTSSPEFTVSTQFWIYWVVVIPLTAAVLLTWRFWIARGEKKSRYDVEGGRKME